MEVHDPYKASFDRCGGGSATLDDQQWTQFLELLESTNFLSSKLAQQFRQEHEAQPHSFEVFQRNLCKWTGGGRVPSSQVDGILDELKNKTQFLRQVAEAQCQNDPINVSFLNPFISQAEAMRDKLTGLEESTSDTLTSKWIELDLFGLDSPPTEYERACPWTFQQANARYLRIEDRQRAKYQLRLHQCDEHTDQVLKETFFPMLQQFCEVQIAIAALTSPSQRDGENAKESELVIALMVQREKACEEAVVWLDNLVSAYRQLSLSPYVQQYLGSEDVSGTKQEALIMEGVTTRHYFDLVQARSLSDVLLEEGILLETSALFKLYARELLLAVIDLLEQSTHQLYTRVLPEHVMISHSGRRLFLGKLDFGVYIDPFQSNSLAAIMQKREKSLLQDLSVVLFSMLYRVTLPQNLQGFRTQYLGQRSSNFVFRYRITGKAADDKTICVSCRDAFEIVLAGNPCFDEVWNCTISRNSVLACINRLYAPMEFQFRTKSMGECIITFSPLGNSTMSPFSLVVRVCSENFRLQTSKAGTLISACAGVGLETTATLSPQILPRTLLQQHAYFQPLSKTDSRDVERELLERE